MQSSKHSNYQILSSNLQSIINEHTLEINSRYEAERLDYILRNISVNGKSILDIGGNTGFFTFEMIQKGAKHATLYEGNKSHAKFVKKASEVLELEDKITVKEKYFTFDIKAQEQYDVTLLLNVLHHVGDDYGDSKSIKTAKEEIIRQLNSFAGKTSMLVFQLGFNWQGNPKYNLFKHGTKSEVIEFITQGTKEFWTIQHMGVAENNNGSISYHDVNNKNIERNDSLGEFLNRPIFILKSR